jgi:hypothetical protein
MKTFSDQEVQQTQDNMICSVDPWYWAVKKKIQLQGDMYSPKGHTWQAGPMQSQAKHRVIRKGAQLGFTECEVLRSLHGLIHKQYEKGVLYLFPTSDDVSDFSKARFGPLIQANPGAIGRYVRSTNSTSIKQIGTGMLYLRGARLTADIEGMKKDSPKLRSVPVDKLVLDERDLMADAAILLAKERLSHSEVKEVVEFSTPTVPGFGIDLAYHESTQHCWLIRCQACNKDTCLESEFPECVVDNKRVCVHCGKEIFPHRGQWVAQYPDRDIEGFWLSQLNSLYIDPGEILRLYLNPPQGNLQEIFNSKLGMAYIDAEDELTKQDVMACCGLDPMVPKHGGPCAMGIDVGKVLHVVIGCKVAPKRFKILRTLEVSNFNDVHDLAKKYNVKNCVIDALPETRTVRAFQEQEKYEIFLCYYKESQSTGPVFNLNTGIVQVNRTEICDQTHHLITEPGKCQLTRWSLVLTEYSKQMASMFKREEVHEKTGQKVFRYHSRGPDHYRHATNYFYLAAQRVGEVMDQSVRQRVAKMDYEILE